MIICISSEYFFTYLPTLVTFTSSSAASISSKIQNGDGFTLMSAKSNAIAMNACSPPDRRFRFFIVFPGGAAFISIPDSSAFSGVCKYYLRVTAAEQLTENLAEILVYLSEGFHEYALHVVLYAAENGKQILP